MPDNTMRLFYTDYKGKLVLALEFAADVDENIYKRLLDECQVKILLEYQQSKINETATYKIDYKPIDPELFTKILILDGDKDEAKIQFLMWELEKRCKLENDFNLPACDKKTAKRKRRKTKNEKSNNC